MTEGDITRLNRMYKCPDYEEEDVEGLVEEDAQIEDEITDENKAVIQKDDFDKTPGISKYLRSLTNGLILVIDPLCKLQRKLKMFLSYIDHM